MLFAQLLQGTGYAGDFSSDFVAQDLVYDSRIAEPGDVFVCLPGAAADGHAYAKAAYDRGCRLFVAERPLSLPEDAAVALVKNSRAALAIMSRNLFGDPAKELTVIGVTGTKGKTTVTHLIKSVLEAGGVKTGIIGTNGVHFGEIHYKTVNTTPESYEIQKTFREMVKAGCECVCMEVSSQGLMTGRVAGIQFQIGVFTNLSPDHIGPTEHKDFADYLHWKAQLFRQCDLGLVNFDDPHGKEITAAATCELIGYGLSEGCAYRGRDIRLVREPGFLGVDFAGETPLGTQGFRLNQPGRFSVYNALVAIAVGQHLGISLPTAARALSKAAIPGRVELVDALPFCTVVLDFAHNEVSMHAILETLREYNPKRLICLFGSVGDRSQLRRAAMAQTAAHLCDYCILTSDNPGNEDPMSILSDMEKGMGEAKGRYVTIPDRAAAVKYAVDMAEEGDILLFAGKGHEDYQLICGQRVPFCERELIRHYAALRLGQPEAEDTVAG